MAKPSHLLGERHSKMWKCLQQEELGNMVMWGRGQCLHCSGSVLARLISGLSDVGAKLLGEGTVHL